MSPPSTSADYDPAAEVVGLCRDLIRLDTSNYGDGSGPGERKAAEYVAGLLDEAGITPTVVESDPGRTSVVATWGGDAGDRLLLHGHLDVVPAAASDWQVDPFAGEIRDGYLWGRGAVDMKHFDAMLLSLVRARAQAGAVPARGLTLCFTADEEAGGWKGAGHLVDHRPELLEGCTEAIGEVGGFSTTVAGRRLYLVEAAEKGMAWMWLTARAAAGHGSMRHAENAVTEVAEAVARLGRHPWPVRLTPTMEALLARVGEISGIPVTAENTEELVAQFGSAARMIDAVVRHTTNPTMLDAGYKVNVIPGEATAHVDGRFLPGHEEEFFATLAELVGKRVEVGYVTHQPALETQFAGDLADAITASLVTHDPDAVVAPYLMSGGTDAKHWRRLGIPGFGFTPLRLPPELDFTALFHGVDERVPVDALEFGARVLDDLLDRV